ncbi:MAG: DUF6505 family protein [Gammaproteobacteria bacterium]|nr:DUF6505 family protein [Gammaproteobacteria bacterium]
MRFLRTIRLDESDAQVFESAAIPGEWAVPGSFTFVNNNPNELTGKHLQAFKHGFLGIESLGWSTLVEIADISESEYRRVIEILATLLVERHGAPDIKTALPAAREEAEYTCSLCQNDLDTLLGLERQLTSEGIVENLKIFRPNAASHSELKLFGPDFE